MLRWAVILSIAGLASLSEAAECYAQDHGNFCIDKGALLGQRSNWCKRNFSALNGNWTTVTDGSGNIAHIGKIGTFTYQKTCEDAYNQIVDECYGHKNGGSWTYGGASLNINFCQV